MLSTSVKKFKMIWLLFMKIWVHLYVHTYKCCKVYKAGMHCLTPKHIFIFLTSILCFQRFMSFKKAQPPYNLFFALYDVWNAFWQCFSPFELRSCRLCPFSDVKRYNYMLICAYCKAWNSYAITVKCSQLALLQSRQHTLNGDISWQRINGYYP